VPEAPGGRNRNVLIVLGFALAPVLFFVVKVVASRRPPPQDRRLVERSGWQVQAREGTAFVEDPSVPPDKQGALARQESSPATSAARPPTPPAAGDPAEAAAQKWLLSTGPADVAFLRQIGARFGVDPEKVASQATYTLLQCLERHPATKKRSDDQTWSAALRFVEQATRPPVATDLRGFIAAFEKFVQSACPLGELAPTARAPYR
jgi:hypothetical protein